MKKVWLSVNRNEKRVDVRNIGKTGNYTVSTGRYGELYLSWQYLYGSADWEDYPESTVKPEQCRNESILLVDMGKMTILFLESYYARDVQHKPRLAIVLNKVKQIAIDIVMNYTAFEVEPVRDSIRKTAIEVIYQWEVRVLEKCSDEFLDKYRI